jgi:Cytochrome c7 and related cytochrome c
MRRVALVLACAVACATAATIFGTPAPSGGDEILFPHARHKKAEVDCLTCHEVVYDAKTLVGDFLPNEAKCLECHKEKKEKQECNFCHLDVRYAEPFAKRDPKLNFDHAAHIDRVKEDCTVCHAQLSEPQHPTSITSGHDTCFKCHEHAQQYADAKCSTCHIDLSAYGLMPVAAVSHQGDFLRRHPSIARSAQETCGTCHEANFCLDCHAKTAMVPIEVKLVDRPDRRFIHTPDFLGRHAVEERADPASCQRCHSASTCETCHQHSGVSADVSPTNPHPSGWTLPGSAQFHGDAARRDITSCASCHDQGAQSNCVSCHKVGGIGGDPHPSGYQSHHSLSEAATDGRCVVCHH